jgi:hypothetical protein
MVYFIQQSLELRISKQWPLYCLSFSNVKSVNQQKDKQYNGEEKDRQYNGQEKDRQSKSLVLVPLE